MKGHGIDTKKRTMGRQEDAKLEDPRLLTLFNLHPCYSSWRELLRKQLTASRVSMLTFAMNVLIGTVEYMHVTIALFIHTFSCNDEIQLIQCASLLQKTRC